MDRGLNKDQALERLPNFTDDELLWLNTEVNKELYKRRVPSTFGYTPPDRPPPKPAPPKVSVSPGMSINLTGIKTK